MKIIKDGNNQQWEVYSLKIWSFLFVVPLLYNLIISLIQAQLVHSQGLWQFPNLVMAIVVEDLKYNRLKDEVVIRIDNRVYDAIIYAGPLVKTNCIQSTYGYYDLEDLKNLKVRVLGEGEGIFITN